MDGRCPFCLGQGTSPVARAVEPRSGVEVLCLMACPDCEKWYWAETGEEVERLFDICETSVINPSRCYEEVRLALNSGGNTFPRRRAAEFNQVCSDCLHARFTAGKKAAYA